MKFGPIKAETVETRFDGTLKTFGLVTYMTVAENTVGVGGLLCTNGVGELVDSTLDTPLRPGLFVALSSGTGEQRVASWGSYIENPAWSFTPGAALYRSASPGEFSESGDSGSAVGFALTPTRVFFGPVHRSFEDAVITIIHEDATFAPMIEVADGAEILWTFSDDTTSTSATPSYDAGEAGPHTATLKVTPWSALEVLNFGYTNDVDGSDLGAEYNLDPQNVSSVTDIQLATGLLAFCAMYNDLLATHLEFGGLTSLHHIEVYSCDTLETIGIVGCTAITRIGIEDCALTELDLSDALLLEDIRASVNQLPSIQWADAEYSNTWHICTQTNPFTEAYTDLAKFPALEDFFLWSANQSGSLVFYSAVLNSVSVYDNDYTSIDVSSGQSSTPGGYFRASTNSNLASVNIDNWTGLTTVRLGYCALPEAMIDYVLTTLDTNGQTGGTVELHGGTNAPPSATGLVAITSLEGKSWTVNVNEDETTIAPTSYSPSAGATSADLAQTFVLTFDEAVTYQAGGTIGLYDYDTDALVEDLTSSLTNDGTTTPTFTATTEPAYGEQYYIAVSAGAFENAGGDPSIEITKAAWNFTFEPLLSSLSPEDNATGVAVSAPLVLTFAEAVTIQAGAVVSLVDYDTDVEVEDVTSLISGDGTAEVTFTPSANYTSGVHYYVTVSAGAFEDDNGNATPAIAKDGWDFTAAVSGTLFEDYFDDYTGTDPSEKGWFTLDTAAHDIDSDQYHRSDSGAYCRTGCPGGGSLPADLKITFTAPDICRSNYWGVTARMDGSGNGLKLFSISGVLRFGTSESSSNVIANITPVWVGTGSHTIEWTAQGDQHTFVIDGTTHGPYTSAVGQGVSGLNFGTCGDAQGDKYYLESVVVESL